MAGALVVTALKALALAKNLSGRRLVREVGWVASGRAVAVVGSMLASCTASSVLSGALPRMFAREPRHAV